MKIINNNRNWDLECTIQLNLKEVSLLAAAVGMTAPSSVEEEFQNWTAHPAVNCGDMDNLYAPLMEYLGKYGIERE